VVVNHGVGPLARLLTSALSEPRMFADQFQRNGVILDQRFGIRNGDTAAVSRGRAAGFTVTFEIAAETRRGDGRVKRRPIRAGTSIVALAALRHPCCPIYPRHPYPPKGAKGQGTMLNQCVGQLTTRRPCKGA
jgi:hypothetical protein